MTPPVTTIDEVGWRRITSPRPGAPPRIAMVLTVTTTRGMLGAGEAAPLPGRSRDDDDDEAAGRAFAALATRLPLVITGDPLAAAAALAAAVTAAPAARFAIETAILDAVAGERGVSLAELVTAAPARSVPVNALVADPDAARRAVARGIRTLKVKVTAADDARARLAGIRAAVGPAVAIRVDVNRGWPRAEALARLAELVDLGLEYVEEPGPELVEIARRAPVPLAADETLPGLDDPAIERILAHGGIVAVVLKPTLIGGLVRARAIAELAHRRGVDAVVTHAFEGPVATAACAELARALRSPRAVGLDAHAGLAGWRTHVPQLGAAHVTAARAPGLGLAATELLADLAAGEPG